MIDIYLKLMSIVASSDKTHAEKMELLQFLVEKAVNEQERMKDSNE